MTFAVCSGKCARGSWRIQSTLHLFGLPQVQWTPHLNKSPSALACLADLADLRSRWGFVKQLLMGLHFFSVAVERPTSRVRAMQPAIEAGAQEQTTSQPEPVPRPPTLPSCTRPRHAILRTYSQTANVPHDHTLGIWCATVKSSGIHNSNTFSVRSKQKPPPHGS